MLIKENRCHFEGLLINVASQNTAALPIITLASLVHVPVCHPVCVGLHYLGGSVRDVQADQRRVEVLQAVCLGHGEWEGIEQG